MAAVFGRYLFKMAVAFQACRENAVEGIPVKGLPVQQFRGIGHIKGRNDEGGRDRHIFFGGCPPAATDRVFQKAVDGIQGAPGAAAGEIELLPLRFYEYAVARERCRVQKRKGAAETVRRADHDLRRIGRDLVLGQNGEGRPRDTSQIVL
ncbi:MAG: hypothetical protein BWY09_01676 [Candidatus Hydrogenedentes bacterium ADurb.Bin179]|nr:MAG: hypothetical protein BWY09_01676 [Candidatus Hydrogenedentes bacterium ADurb.Bin179]